MIDEGVLDREGNGKGELAPTSILTSHDLPLDSRVPRTAQFRSGVWEIGSADPRSHRQAALRKNGGLALGICSYVSGLDIHVSLTMQDALSFSLIFASIILFSTSRLRLHDIGVR